MTRSGWLTQSFHNGAKNQVEIEITFLVLYSYNFTSYCYYYILLPPKAKAKTILYFGYSVAIFIKTVRVFAEVYSYCVTIS